MYQGRLKMKVRELMSTNAVFCRPETNLAAVGALMWEHDCGLIPVVDDTERVTGVITDRDICIALSTRDRQPSKITAREITTAPARVCSPDDDIQTALITMSRERLHRLPVVNRERGLVGILSINDLLLHAEKGLGKRPGISYEDVVQTLQAICTHPAGTVHAMAG
jgi:CBS domain-containing protein